MMTSFDHDHVFSGTDYLGTSRDPSFQKIVRESVENYGLHYGGSRWANNCPQVYDLCEKSLSAYFEMGDVLLFSSGSLAALFIQQITAAVDSVFYPKDLHPSLLYSQFKGVAFANRGELMQLCKNNRGKIALLFNAVNPSTVELFDFTWLSELPQNKEYLLVLDDSHGLGLLGDKGEGVLLQRDLLPENVELIILASLGKSYGLPGGLIMGRKQRISRIRWLSNWGGASPPSPYVADILASQMNYFQKRRIRLRQKLALFDRHLKHPERMLKIENFPVYLIREKEWYEKLINSGFLISAFAYPDPNGTRIERIVLNAAKKDQDIIHLCELINDL